MSQYDPSNGGVVRVLAQFRWSKGKRHLFSWDAWRNEIVQKIIRPVLFDIDFTIDQAQMQRKAVEAFALQPAQTE